MNYQKARRGSSKLKKGKKFTYQVKSYQNPYFNNKKKTAYIANNWQWKQKAIITGIAAVILFFFWLFFASPLFRIRDIEIRNLSDIASTSTPAVDEENAKEIASLQKQERKMLLSQDNYFLYDTRMVNDKLADSFPFYYFSITKSIRGKIIIECKTKDFTAVWVEDGKYFFIDNEGKVISEINPLELKQKKYPLIKNNGNQRIKDNTIPDVDAEKAIVAIDKELAQKQTDLKSENFELNNEEYTIKLKIQNGPEILFNTKNGTEEQVNKLISVRGTLKDDFLKQTYVDLRYGDRVYTK